MKNQKQTIDLNMGKNPMEAYREYMNNLTPEEKKEEIINQIDTYTRNINLCMGIINLNNELLNAEVGDCFKIKANPNDEAYIVQEVTKITKGGHVTTELYGAEFNEDNTFTKGKFLNKKTNVKNIMIKDNKELQEGIDMYQKAIDKCNEELDKLDAMISLRADT